ncbi:MAG: hypothetical protein IKR23_02795 [Lachnospiraceae bacterium]|nr:hypothetical protein [Lachnospiraceae bacterium]
MENNVFNNALSNMSFEMAARGAIRHLYDSGYSIKEIADRLTYPLPVSRIEKEISDYEKEKSSPDAEYEYIRTTDAYGRSSYKRVRKDSLPDAGTRFVDSGS